jgi:putative transcriptional regulator
MEGQSLMQVLLENAHDIGADKITMRKLEELALPEIKQLTSEEIRQIRENANLSQGIWSRLLNVGVTTVQKWERGETKPDGASMKLLNLVKSNGVGVLIH